MKLLALSDLHGDYSKVDAILQRAGDIDAVLIVGDITNFGPDKKARELIGKFKVPVLAIPGNCDHPSILGTLDEAGAVNLHEKRFTMGGVEFIGMGGSNATPFNTPFEMSDSDVEKTLGELVGQCCGNLTVLLSHAPPHGYRDEIPAGHVGSRSVAKFLDSLGLIVCGHIHEARGAEKCGNTTIVNVGEASKGYGALISINGEIDVEFIKV